MKLLTKLNYCLDKASESGMFESSWRITRRDENPLDSRVLSREFITLREVLIEMVRAPESCNIGSDKANRRKIRGSFFSSIDPLHNTAKRTRDKPPESRLAAGNLGKRRGNCVTRIRTSAARPEIGATAV